MFHRKRRGRSRHRDDSLHGGKDRRSRTSHSPRRRALFSRGPMPRYLLRSAASHLDEMESARAPAAKGPSSGGIPRSLSLARGSKLVSRRRLGSLQARRPSASLWVEGFASVGIPAPAGLRRVDRKGIPQSRELRRDVGVPGFFHAGNVARTEILARVLRALYIWHS